MVGWGEGEMGDGRMGIGSGFMKIFLYGE